MPTRRRRTTPKAVFSLWKCFKDHPNRAFDGGSIRVGKNAETVNNCMARCKDNKYMGVQDGDECFCGNTIKIGGVYEELADSDCSNRGTECPVTDGCGGPWKNSIYILGPADPTDPGCWVLTPSGCTAQNFDASTWQRDTWGEANKGAGDNEITCLVTRKFDFDGWCGDSNTRMDFNPKAPTLSEPGNPCPGGCGNCEGDCDDDAECKSGFMCYQRDGYELVPGCVGQGKRQWDYCIAAADVVN